MELKKQIDTLIPKIKITGRINTQLKIISVCS
jgi:hypothetical protein